MAAQALSKKNAKVVVVDHSASGRQLVSDVLRGLDFLNIEVLASGKDAIGFLETEFADWIIMPLMADQPINAMHLLKIFSEHSRFASLRASLLVDTSEEYVLPLAYELGLMSHHRKVYFKEPLEEAIRGTIDILKFNDWSGCLTAATYLRTYLVKRRQYEALLKLEENLLDVFPGKVSLLPRLAEAQLLGGESAKGASTLRQVGLIDEGPKMKAVIDHLRTKYGVAHKPADPTETSAPKYNVLGVSSCVLIDPDTSVQHAITQLLIEVGVGNVETFSDGKSALEWLESNKEPDLIIQEWRLPEVTGPLLIQKIRQLGHISVPIVIISSLIKPQEAPLLREMGVSDVCHKPFEKQMFFRTIIWTLQQERNPTEQKSLERKIRQALELGHAGEAERLKAQYLENTAIAPGYHRQIEAEFEYYNGRFRKARDLGIQALKLSGDSLILLNLVGKCLLKLRDHASALKFFEKAQSLSPLNIDRLLAIAEVQVELGAITDASSTLDAATTLDPDSVKLAAMKVNVSILEGNTNKARKLLSEIKDVAKIIAYMNNRAVALIRCGRYEDGIKLYEKTLETLPDDWSDVHASVAYNLGLAFARYGDHHKAIAILSELTSKPACELTPKAESLLKRVEKSLSDGTPLNFVGGDDETKIKTNDEGNAADDDQDESFEDLALSEVRKGDLCCNMIFTVPQADIDPAAVELLKQMPRFRARRAIQRNESFGGGMAS